MAISVDRMRIGGSKVKSGCRTCKARRVKCDEAKPQCGRCLKAGRVCEGYSPPNASAPRPIGAKFIYYVDQLQSLGPDISRSPSPHAGLENEAIRSLDFFQHHTVIQLEYPFGVDLWSGWLSRLMNQESAIQHGIVALAALHENFILPSDSSYAIQRKVLALDHYGKSIKGMVRLNQKAPGSCILTNLTSCLLYCAIEAVQGHFFSAVKHVLSGVHLMADYERQLLTAESVDLVAPEEPYLALRRAFIGLGTQAMGLEDSIMYMDPVVLDYLSRSHEVASAEFETIDEALSKVATLGVELMVFDTKAESSQLIPSITAQPLLAANHQLQQRYDDWTRAYHKMLAKNTTIRDQSVSHAALLKLRVNQILVRVMLKVSFCQDQSGFDQCLSEFANIVTTCEDLLAEESRHKRQHQLGPGFSLSLGVLPALFFTCFRCRDHAIRSHALELLKRSKRREAVWDSDLLSGLAEQLIELEESQAKQHRRRQSPDAAEDTITTTQDLPESVRIHDLALDFLDSDNRAQISMHGQHGVQKDFRYFEWKE